MTHTLQCRNCRESYNAVVIRPVITSLDQARVARENGWHVVRDDYENRILIFCSSECAEDCRNDDGSFRK